MEELTTAIETYKYSSNSVDLDDIHPLMFRGCGYAVMCLLWSLFNAALLNGSWPWDTSRVVFIRKRGKNAYNVPSSFRPITISSHIGKLFEKILEKRLRLFVESSGLIPSYQHGFRKNMSTSTCLFQMISTIQHRKAQGDSVAGLILDLQKAFDSVWTEGILYWLQEIGVTGPHLKTLPSFLSHRFIRLQVNSFFSDPLPCSVGLG